MDMAENARKGGKCQIPTVQSSTKPGKYLNKATSTPGHARAEKRADKSTSNDWAELQNLRDKSTGGPNLARKYGATTASRSNTDENKASTREKYRKKPRRETRKQI